jgi:hypothetical protein
VPGECGRVKITKALEAHLRGALPFVVHPLVLLDQIGAVQVPDHPETLTDPVMGELAFPVVKGAKRGRFAVAALLAEPALPDVGGFRSSGLAAPEQNADQAGEGTDEVQILWSGFARMARRKALARDG